MLLPGSDGRLWLVLSLRRWKIRDSSCGVRGLRSERIALWREWEWSKSVLSRSKRIAVGLVDSDDSIVTVFEAG